MESFQSVCPILSDGFSDFSSYTGHNLAVKGLILMDESTQSMSSTFDQFITWDMKQTHMWRLDRVSGTTKAIKVVKFSEEKPNFIVSILYIAKMQLIIMSAEDLTFKLYDREMKFLESIRHQESAVFSMEYDSPTDSLLLSGANGVSAWKITKIKKASSQSSAFELEKLFEFKDLKGSWIAKMASDLNSKYIYAFLEQSVYVLCPQTRTVVSTLSEIHAQPVTACVWYPLGQFFLTGCSQGILKCISMASSLLFQFAVHSAAITGLGIHPMPGLAISTSLDCHVKVLNLESYTVLFDINTNKSIINLKSICFSKRSSACVISQKNGAISVLKATSCADYFNTCSLAVQSATRFQRLNSGYKMLVPKNKVISPKKIAPPCPASYQNSSCNFMQKEQEDSDDTDTSESDGDYESDHSVEKPPPVVKEMRRLSRKKSGGDICHPTNRIREEHELAKKLAKEKEKEREKNRDSSSDYSSCVVASSAQDLCVFLESGQLRSRIDSRLVIDGVKCYTISVAQELLFVYFESGRLSVFCVRTLEGRLLKSLPAGNAELKNVVCMVLVDTILRETERMDFDDARKNSSGTKDPRNYPKSDATFNEYKRRASRTANRRSSEQQSLQKKYDLRNNLLSSYENIGCQEMVLLGTVTGMLYGMNTTTDKLNDCNTWDLGVSFQYRVEKQESTTIERMTFRSYGSDLRRPSLNGDTGVGGMNYGRRKSFMNRRCHGKDLFIVSNEKSTTALGRRTLRVYSLPSLECTYVLKNILTFTSFEVSLSLPYLAMGYDDGNVKLFELMRKGGTGADTVENDFNDMISRRNSLLMTGGDPGSRASNELTRRSSCDYIAEGVIREITQSGMSHTDKVTSISFNDKLKLYVTSSLDCTVRVWNFKKQEITILNFKSPSICVLFYGFDSGNVASPNATIVKGNEFEKARDSILILQRNYLLSVRKNIWDPENKVAVEYNPKTPPVVEGVEGDMVARNGGGFSPGDVEYLEQILRLSNPNGSVSFSGVGSSGPVSTPRAVSCPALTPPATVITSPMIVRPPLSYSPVPLAVSFADSTPYVPSNSSTANKIQRAKDFTDTFAENSFNSPTTSDVPVAAGLNGIAEIQITPHVRASRRNSSPFPIANNNTFPFPAPLDIETNFVSPSRLPRGYMNSCMTSIGNTSTDSHDSFGYNSSYTLSNTSNNSGYPSDDEGPKEREREKDREKDGIMSGINSGTSSSKIRSRSGSFNLNVRVPLNGKPTRISGIMGMGGVRKERDRRTPGDEGGIVALKMGLDLREVTNNSMNLAICSFSTNLLTAHTSTYNSSNSSRIGTHSNNTPRAGTGTLNSARYSM